MIPQTAEVESLALLTPGARPSLECVWRGLEGAVVDAPPYLSSKEVCDRAEQETGMKFAQVDRHASWSGVTWLTKSGEGPCPTTSWTIVLAKGITTSRGDLAGVRYRRVAAVGEHSLVEVETSHPIRGVLDALARAGHPVIGSAGCDSATNRHFAEKHGLDRPFVHVARLVGPDGQDARSPLAGDLCAVLASLGFEGEPPAP
jgi:hypothetical protein